jgi:hypothetical protein
MVENSTEFTGKKHVKELEYVYSQLSDIKDSMIRNRVENVLLWYVNKAKKSKAAYYAAMIISIFASASIPVISTINSNPGGVSTKDIIISCIAAISGISTSICALFNFKEAWNRNRKYAEKLKSECFLYITHSGDYFQLKAEDADNKFISKIESLSSDENQHWVEENKKNTFKG